jgi:exodeoxyribonuclease VII small subunit
LREDVDVNDDAHRTNWPQTTESRGARLGARRVARYIRGTMSKKNLQTPPKNFEDALAELEQILSDIEAGHVGLEQSLQKYERGSFLIQHCRTVLAKAEQQIEMLSKGPDGQIVSEPMEEDVEEEEEEEE